MNICGNVSLFEHSQYFIDAGASLDQRPSIPVKDEVAALILAKSKQDGFVVGVENGGHALTVVHQRWDTCAGKSLRIQLVAGIGRNSLSTIDRVPYGMGGKC